MYSLYKRLRVVGLKSTSATNVNVFLKMNFSFRIFRFQLPEVFPFCIRLVPYRSA